jgi:hypothetical protein
MRLQATSSRLAPQHLPLFLGLHPQATAHEATTLKLLGALWTMPSPTLTYSCTLCISACYCFHGWRMQSCSGQRLCNPQELGMIIFELNFCWEEEEVNLRIFLGDLRMGVLLNLLTERKNGTGKYQLNTQSQTQNLNLCSVLHSKMDNHYCVWARIWPVCYVWVCTGVMFGVLMWMQPIKATCCW